MQSFPGLLVRDDREETPRLRALAPYWAEGAGFMGRYIQRNVWYFCNSPSE